MSRNSRLIAGDTGTEEEWVTAPPSTILETWSSDTLQHTINSPWIAHGNTTSMPMVSLGHIPDVRAVSLTVGIVMIPVMLFTILGCGMIVSAMVKFSWLHTNTHFLLLSMCFTLLVNSLLVQPLVIYGYLKSDGDPSLPTFLCSFISRADFVIVFLFVLHFIAINADLYIALEYPMKYQLMVTKRITRVVILGMWMVGVGFGGLMVWRFTTKGLGCWPSVPSSGNGILLLLGFLFLLPFAVACLAYARIYIIVCRHLHFVQSNSATVRSARHGGGNQEERHRDTSGFHRLIACVLGIRFLGYAPIVTLLPLIYYTDDMQMVMNMIQYGLHVTRLISEISLSLNPVIFVVCSKKLKKALTLLISGPSRDRTFANQTSSPTRDSNC